MKKCSLLLLFFWLPLFAAPQVVVSIKPIHDVTLAVMEGAGTPTLLVPPGTSPHNYALAPSQAQALYQADLIIWIGPSLETFLTQPLNRRKKDSTLLTLLDTPNMILYPIGEKENAHEHGPIDPHLWLDPVNLIHFTSQLASTLSTLDPQHAKLYQTNAQRTIKHLLTLDQTLSQQLKGAHHQPIMVFHDAYQYFSKRYGLDVVGTVVLRPDVMPSVSRVLQIQDTLKSKKVTCIFTEPQFKPAVVERLVANTQIKVGVLDPLGSPSPSGLLGIEALFNNLSKGVTGCLKPA
jgi:zinc transport system substrate-binding protein